jgi:hypothetical protein
MLVTRAHVTAYNCTIARNDGGFYGGGISSDWNTDLLLQNCLIMDNYTGYDGGGVAIWDDETEVAFVNCTIAGNVARTGGGVFAGSETGVEITNSILWDNHAEDGPQLAIRGPSTAAIVSHCALEGGDSAVHVEQDTTLDWGPGNIDADPLFVDPGEGDYHLAPGSPCIDAGCNCGVPADVTDLDGEGRFFDDPDTPDSGSGWPPVVDMGAYEFGDTGPRPCRGDLDNDRDVDLADLAALLPNLGTTSGATVADGDLDCDGDVDLSDLSALLAVYGTSCE